MATSTVCRAAWDINSDERLLFRLLFRDGGAVVIRYQGFHLPLPHEIARCPTCKRGMLRWDGRNAWRCTRKRCHEGRSLAAFFDVEDIELRLQCGYQLEQFPLTDMAIDLLRLGVIAFDWVSAEQAQWMFERFQSISPGGEAEEAVAWLMREIPALRGE